MFYACNKKKAEVEPPLSVNTGSGTVNMVCYGKGTNTYLPLDSLNAWNYDYKVNGVDQNDAPSPRVVGFVTINSLRYAKVKDRILTMYYRTEPATNDIYCYDGWGTEYLEIPGNPVLNQTWATNTSTSRRVSNLSATITTSKCTYTGLLEISEMIGNATVTGLWYYKKGLGLVYAASPGGTPVKQSLISVDLK